MLRIAIALLVLGLFLSFIINIALRKGVSGIKLMLLGINITLFGGIIAADPNSNFGGIEYLIALAGLIMSIIGLNRE
ncbi:hypothetical protein ciss_08460 [Carboxydothermus islandicus]|uniref:Uncharacterized protein n=1 Tax=Carboxydothermus islandicus TaxID=661089 RepID=A0A1L8D194_9THEO|nr:hypothetical protein [Carboxydothermus islandicus]GAV24913.1 hypothetical protein ciss_08460 [Carboxydothermus islandicus]